MNRELVIISSKDLYLYVIFEDGEAVELRVEYKDLLKQSGNIYKGKVKRIVPAMNAAFIDIGEDREAFLPLKDINHCGELKINESVIVQVKRSAVGNKGAKLSCKVTLPGKYLVLIPNNSYVSISSKIEDKEQRENLKEHIKWLLEPFNDKEFGYIIRTSASEASDEAIIEDFISLKQLWENILKTSKKKKTPSLLYEESSKIYSILRDYAGKFSKIVSDDIKKLKEVKEYIKKNFKQEIKLEPYRKRKISLYTYYEIDKIINKILNPYVWLKNGGYLVIEETEALVSIDVNSGSHCKHKSLEETAYHTNIEAMKEIAKHLRLRDLGGIIIIDFIDMKDEEKKKALIEQFQNEIKKDKRPVKIKSFTSLGLLELTRKKIEDSLIKQLTDVCFTCTGNGFIKSKYLLMFEIEKKISEMKPFVKLTIRINPAHYKAVKKLISELKLEDSIDIISDSSQHINKFSVEREI
ncbi:ribonuclease G [Persephonella hydrogeniphila]|uniref:Ribonuclease G n=1 Tax=Persephonella hydrogeniphila TaxID=198703 RepID=A0A285MZP7_9AQUI|nr:Rne/Rng family ribonuclease [Persephonella hydrogeniphila]SNZ02660.1 ribonuclease G [Persephonella hydrogeniphila]